MAKREYVYERGPEAKERFENAMRTVFKAPKQSIEKPSKRGPTAQRKPAKDKP